jgi:arylsulfatase A
MRLAVWLLTSIICCASPGAAKSRPPNFILVFVDDLGYGDLGCYGHPAIRTPHLDRLAWEGQKWTSFYTAANVCTPSRAGLLTGRWPIRSGMCSDRALVLYAGAKGGLPAEEITLAEMLKTRGYATACIGKWHLGELPEYLPPRQGFDYFYGTPFSNDEKVSDKWRDAFRGAPSWDIPLFYHPKSEYWDIPLIRQDKVIERPVDQTQLTKDYVKQTLDFIEHHKGGPFFIYLAPNMPHVPLFSSEGFRGAPAGPYGDAVEEIDGGVGRIVRKLADENLSKDTLLVFTSDNGPWLEFREHGGSAGPLRDGKGTTWEGGHRVPAIFWWPGRIKPSTTADIGCTLDLFTTIGKLAGARLPEDRVIDGLDLEPRLLGKGASPRQEMFYYRGRKVYAVRSGAFKAHLFTKPGWGRNLRELRHEPPLLYQLGQDPGEKYDVAGQYPAVVERIRKILSKHQADIVPGEDQLTKGFR